MGRTKWRQAPSFPRQLAWRNICTRKLTVDLPSTVVEEGAHAQKCLVYNQRNLTYDQGAARLAHP